MNNSWILGVCAAVIIIGGYVWYASTQQDTASEGLGSYAYNCSDGSAFLMTPADDMSSVTVEPGAGATFSKTVLAKKDSTAGQRYEGGGITFVGAGEEVQLTVGGTLLVCNPKPSSELAPWNWGDAGEGGIKQDTVTIVSESIVGVWRSVEDAKFVREFKAGGKVADSYENTERSTGTYVVFTKERPVVTPFPLEEQATYVQLTMQGTQADNLNFKISKLTPEELELIYMDRGGALLFKRVQ